MTGGKLRRAGAPLTTIAALLAGWIVLRVLVWNGGEPPASLAARTFADTSLLATGKPLRIERGSAEVRAAEALPIWHPVAHAGSAPPALRYAPARPVPGGSGGGSSRLPPTTGGGKVETGVTQAAVAASRPSFRQSFGAADGSPGLPAVEAPAELPQPPATYERMRRFSLDTWAFLREGAQRQRALGPRPASLGASQIGVVGRYALAPAHSLRPAAFVRVSRALVADGESEAAAGVLMRPAGDLPVAAHAEVRLTRQNGELEVRPAAFLTAGMDGQELAAGLEARGYAQAGYVGGKHATAFADGHLVAEKPVAETPLGSVRVGGGVWGGAQKGAARLDLGPSASLEAKVAEAPIRLEASYRVRAAGEAEPGSGFALTLSTGF